MQVEFEHTTGLENRLVWHKLSFDGRGSFQSFNVKVESPMTTKKVATAIATVLDQLNKPYENQ